MYKAKAVTLSLLCVFLASAIHVQAAGQAHAQQNSGEEQNQSQGAEECGGSLHGQLRDGIIP